MPSPPSPNAKFATPWETLKTLYFSIIAYDLQPTLVNDAVACLEPTPDCADDFCEAARLAFELETVLRELCLPVEAAPESAIEDVVSICDTGGFKIGMRRQVDRTWRFDHDTVERIPTMYRLALVRHHDLQAQRTGLREEYTDPSATMRRFLIDSFAGDYYAAAQALDLSKLSIDERSERGPVLAQQLMFVIQRRGWIYFQEVPNHPEGPPYTWHVDGVGRVMLQRTHGCDGKDAWLFGKNTVKNLDKMYEAVRNQPPDPRYVQLGRVVPPIAAAVVGQGQQRPASVPSHLGSPRAVLKGFFRAVDEAEADDKKLIAAIEYLDLEAMRAADRPTQGVKLAAKLDAVLRKLDIDLSAVADTWNAPPQPLGLRQGLKVELARRRDGSWRFSQATVEQIPQLFDKLAAQQQADRNRVGHLETARDTMVTFLGASNHHHDGRAARCLDLSALHPSACDTIGPVLAFKLKYVIDRIGRVYPEEIPDDPEGPRYVFHNGDLGRIVVARKADGAAKGKWLFSADTIEQIEPMFVAALGRPVDESLRGSFALREPDPWETPGIWLRLQLPPWAKAPVGSLELYQWAGLVLSLLVSRVAARLLMRVIEALAVWLLKRSGSVLTAAFVAAKARPLTWTCTGWLFFKLPALLDLPVLWLDTILPARTFLMAALLGWLGFQMIDLLMAIYTNSELLRPHRNLSDMIVPVCMRLTKGGVIVFILGYVVYQVGHGDSLVHFLTGLGAVGLAASLAAQDILL